MLRNAVFECADALNGNAHGVAGLQEARRGETNADARRRAGADHIARLELDAGREAFDQRGDIEDQVPHIGLLAKRAVDPAFNRGVLGAECVGGDDPRAHGAQAVEGFAEEPLAVVLLQVACGHVIDDGVAPYVSVGVFPGNAFAAFADDHGQLCFIVQLARDRGVQGDRGVMADHRLWGLGENHRKLRGDFPVLGAVVETRLAELRRVLVIVLADAKDISRGGERCEEGRAFQRQAVAVRGEPCLQVIPLTDQLLQAAGKRHGQLTQRPIALAVGIDQRRQGLTVAAQDIGEFHRMTPTHVSGDGGPPEVRFNIHDWKHLLRKVLLKTINTWMKQN